ncbi:unnamed protein product [Malus baccata var. baccata]
MNPRTPLRLVFLYPFGPEPLSRSHIFEPECQEAFFAHVQTHFVYVLMLHCPTFCAIQHRRPYCRPIKFSLELQWPTTITQHARCTLPLHPSSLYSMVEISI